MLCSTSDVEKTTSKAVAAKTNTKNPYSSKKSQ
jgi:hypothetical protein